MKTFEIYHLPVLDRYLSEMFEEIRIKVSINAQTWGARSLPEKHNKKLHAYFQEDHLKYQALIDHVNKEARFRTRCAEVLEKEREVEIKVKALQNKLTEAKERQVSKDAALRGKKSPYSKARIPIVWGAIGAIALFEGILSTPCYISWGLSFIVAIIAGLLFSLALAVFAHVFMKIIFIGKTLNQQSAIAIALTTLLTCIFIYMATARATSLTKEVAENAGDKINMHFSPIPYALTSVLLFIVAVAVNHFFYPNAEQCATMEEYQKLRKEKVDNEAVIATIEDEITKAKAESFELKSLMLLYWNMAVLVKKLS